MKYIKYSKKESLNILEKELIEFEHLFKLPREEIVKQFKSGILKDTAEMAQFLILYRNWEKVNQKV